MVGPFTGFVYQVYSRETGSQYKKVRIAVLKDRLRTRPTEGANPQPPLTQTLTVEKYVVPR